MGFITSETDHNLKYILMTSDFQFIFLQANSIVIFFKKQEKNEKENI